MNSQINFGKALKKLRVEKKYSAKDLSEKLNLSTNMIYEWEHGRCSPNLEALIKLTQIFNVSVDYLVGREDEFGNVTVSTPLSNGLNGQEEELIKNFRLLNSYQKDAIALQAQIMADDSLKLEKK